MQAVEVSDAAKYKVFCRVLNKVWLALTDNGKKKWLSESDNWVYENVPVNYPNAREIVQSEIDIYQSVLGGDKTGS